MQTSTIYASDYPTTAAPSQLLARRRAAKRVSGPPALRMTQAEAPAVALTRFQNIAEKNTKRLLWAVASALTAAVTVGAVIGVFVATIGILIVSGLNADLSALTLASIVAVPAGSALIGGLIGARSALRVDDGTSKARRVRRAEPRDPALSSFILSNGTSPPRYTHELL